jgi:hypothetical protein
VLQAIFKTSFRRELSFCRNNHDFKVKTKYENFKDFFNVDADFSLRKLNVHGRFSATPENENLFIVGADLRVRP